MMTGSLLSVLRVLALRGLGVLLSLGTAVGIAFHFGAGPLTDAFFLVRRLFGSVVLLVDSLCNAILVPRFVETARKHDTSSYLRLLYRREIAFFLSGIGFAGLAIAFAGPLISMMAPGLKEESRTASVTFFVIMALTLPITFSTAYVGAALTAIRQFSMPVAVRLAPRVLIVLAILLVPLGMGMTGIVAAAVLGNVVTLAALWMIRRRLIRQPGAAPAATSQTLPTKAHAPARTAAIAVLAVYFLAVILSESYAASFVGVGALAILGLGQRISTLGVSEMLNSVLTVYYTSFSEKAQDPHALAIEMRGALQTGYFFTAPVTLCLAVLAPSIAELILANGAFSVDAARAAGALVAWFAVAALVNTGMSIFEAAILAGADRQAAWHMLRACAATLGLRIAAMIALLPTWGLNAIGAAAVLGPALMAVLHYRFLSRRVDAIVDRAGRAALTKICAVALLCAGMAVCVQAFWPFSGSGLGQTAMLVVAVGIAGPTYLLICARLGIQDAQKIVSALSARLRR